MKSAEARISFSPLALESRLVESTHMNSGIMQMRMSVMELGRFTAKPRRRYPAAPLDYPPPRLAKATRKRRGCAAVLRYFISMRIKVADTQGDRAAPPASC